MRKAYDLLVFLLSLCGLVCTMALAYCAGIVSRLRPLPGRAARWLRRRGPRLGVPALMGNLMLLFIWFLAPQAVPVMIFKLCAVLLAGWNGYWLHRAVLPYAQPSGQLKTPWREELGSMDVAGEHHELRPGKELLFIHQTWQRTAFTLIPMLAVAWAM